jgi:hypothetical protein
MAVWQEQAGVITLSTGRTISARGKVLGMRVDGRFLGEFGWNGQLFFSGHDEAHPTRAMPELIEWADLEWTSKERQELADFMSACWQAWAKG